jgi:hypothetical protein
MTSRAFDLHPDGARFVLSPGTRGPGGAKVDKGIRRELLRPVASRGTVERLR